MPHDSRSCLLHRSFVTSLSALPVNHSAKNSWIPSLLSSVFVYGRDIRHNTANCSCPLLSASNSAPSLNRLWELCSATRCRWLFILEKCNKAGNFIGLWSLLDWNWVFWTHLFFTVISFCRCDGFSANEMHVRRCLLLALRDEDDCYWVIGLVLPRYIGILFCPPSADWLDSWHTKSGSVMVKLVFIEHLSATSKI